jgi:hypothetical protein
LLFLFHGRRMPRGQNSKMNVSGSPAWAAVTAATLAASELAVVH